ncbi:MAG: hypothetical protein IPQ09_18120 [Myxococcales bacterium]|nr:hypothetical protein [Myxococcales bacterium]
MSTRRRPPLRSLLALGALLAPLASLGFVACSSSVSRPPTPEQPALEAGRPPVLGPDAQAPFDSSVPDVDPRPPFDPADEAVVCASTPCVVELAAGAAHFCARMSDGTVRCWGNDPNGELGGAAPPIVEPDAGAPDAGEADARPTPRPTPRPTRGRPAPATRGRAMPVTPALDPRWSPVSRV